MKRSRAEIRPNAEILWTNKLCEFILTEPGLNSCTPWAGFGPWPRPVGPARFRFAAGQGAPRFSFLATNWLVFFGS